MDHYNLLPLRFQKVDWVDLVARKLHLLTKNIVFVELENVDILRCLLTNSENIDWIDIVTSCLITKNLVFVELENVEWIEIVNYRWTMNIALFDLENVDLIDIVRYRSCLLTMKLLLIEIENDDWIDTVRSCLVTGILHLLSLRMSNRLIL